MKKWCFIALAILTIVPTIQAQELDIDISNPLSLEQCIEIALQGSPSIKRAELSEQAANLDVKNARAKYFPEIGISGQY